MNKSIILIFSLSLLSFSNDQYSDNNNDFSDNKSDGGNINAYATYTEPVTSLFSFSGDGKINEHLKEKILYDAHIKNRKLHGSWQSWYENGYLCDSGTFVKGLPDGEWKHWDINGRLIALRTYSADKFNRINNELVRYNPRRISFPLTALYQRNKRAALRYLRASYSFAGAARRKQGVTLQELITANVTPGNEYQPVFDQSLHHGLYINYFTTGLAKDSGYYQNGLRHGVWIHRDRPNGTTERGSYEHGIRVKAWRTYDSNGQILSIVQYNSKGEPGWRKSFR